MSRATPQWPENGEPLLDAIIAGHGDILWGFSSANSSMPAGTFGLPRSCSPKPQHSLDLECPQPPDLTPHIVRMKNQHSAGGTFGDVYRCRYHGGSVSTEVAVKAFRFIVTVDDGAGKESTKMLRRELGIWRRLKHNNIVPFLGIAYGFGMDGTMSLVSLWMPNESLHKFLAIHTNNLGTVHRLRLLLDVANGLDYLHSFPIVHGDLNCNNVLLDADYTACLGDFGYASLVGTIPEALAYLQRSTLRPGALRWTAPEQLDPAETFTRTTKSDMYSFGCVFSSKLPWSEVREDAAVILRLAKGYKPGRPESRKIDDSHWELIQSCWLPIDDRPAAETVGSCIRQFLSYYPPYPPLRDLFVACSNHVDFLADESSSNQTATKDSSNNLDVLDMHHPQRPPRVLSARSVTSSHAPTFPPTSSSPELEASYSEFPNGTMRCQWVYGTPFG